ncbi:MAG: hypothetical protein ACLSHC_09135 [Bilophila wadsworthia]
MFTIADLLPHLAQKEVTKTVADAFDAEKLNVIPGHSPPSASDTDETAKEQKDPGPGRISSPSSTVSTASAKRI